MLISVDAKQLEWRVCLELCRDEVGIKEVLEGQDTHALNQVAFNLPSRLISKIYLFRTIFNWGKGYAFTVDPDFMHVSTSVEYWDKVGEKFYTKYKALDGLYRTNLNLVANKLPIVGPLGLFWPIEMGRDSYGNLKQPYTLVVNYPVQGTAAQVMALARVSLFNRLKKQNLLSKCHLITTVHDSIVVDAPSQYVGPVAQLYKDVFAHLQTNIYKVYGYKWIVPLDCEVKVGKNMKDMEEL